jgi:Protein of unknown function (DUF2721)
MGESGLIAQTIQLAMAPVFVLVAIGNLMNTRSGRLGRVVDRSRHLQRQHPETTGPEHDRLVREIRSTDRRIALIGRAILLLVLSGLTIGLVVALLFVEEMLEVELQTVAAAAFFVAVALLMSALWVFLKEVREATAALRIPKTYLELEREL